MVIKILEKDPNERGRLFEKFVSIMLDAFDYKNLVTRSIKRGYEIDLEGSQAIEGHAVVVECKVHKKPIDSTALKVFFTKYYLKRKQDPHTFGALFSLSELNGGARAFLEELRKTESDLRFRIQAERLAANLTNDEPYKPFITRE